MRTTVELPDTLHRQAKAEAALRGRKLKDLVEEGLRLLIEAPPDTAVHPTLAGLMKPAERPVPRTGRSMFGTADERK